jgi:hypothetical protein
MLDRALFGGSTYLQLSSMLVDPILPARPTLLEVVEDVTVDP